MHKTWERFKKKLTQCPNYNMADIHLIETLYMDLNSVMKSIIDNATGGSFVDLYFQDTVDILNRMAKRS